MLKFSSEFWSWIDEHKNDDVLNLKLKYQGKLQWLDSALCQIQARHSCKKKLYDTLKNDRFYFPDTLSSEQCTGDSLAEFHATLVDKGSTVLDMTAGLGIDAFHIAEKCCHVTAIERKETLCEALKYNASVLGIENIEIINADSVQYITDHTAHYDTVFIDPARRGNEGERIYNIRDCQPSVPNFIDTLRRQCSTLIVKASPMLDITQSIKDFDCRPDIYVVSDGRECKELVIKLDMTATEHTPVINVWTPGRAMFSFTPDEEEKATVDYGIPAQGDYLHIPSAAIMKAAPFKLLSSRYGLTKLAPNSHIYFSAEAVANFPGAILKIVKAIPYTSGNIKRFAREFPCAEVTTRNFGMTPKELIKKLKIKEGGTLRVIATTAQNEEKLLIVGEPISSQTSEP